MLRIRWTSGKPARVLLGGRRLAYVILGCLLPAEMADWPVYSQDTLSAGTASEKQNIYQTAHRKPAHSSNPSAQPAPSTSGAKNIILMIGDGMGPQQLGLLEMYAHRAPNSVVPDRTPAMERMMA